MDLQWDLLRSFLAVVRGGTLSAAAKTLGMSQPSIGRHVRQLEGQMAIPLFERHGPRLLPTPFALELAEEVGGMARVADGIGGILAAQKAERASSVRVTASRVMATLLLPQVLAECPGTGPRIELLADDALANLAQREADIAIRLVRPEQKSVVMRRVGTLRFGFYAARTYLEQHGLPQTLGELKQHALVGFDRSESMVRSARRLGLPEDASEFSFRSDDRVVQWAAVVSGHGIGVLPTYLKEGSELQRILPEVRLPYSPVWIAAPREVRKRAHVALIFDHLRDRLMVHLGEASP